MNNFNFTEAIKILFHLFHSLLAIRKHHMAKNLYLVDNTPYLLHFTHL